MVYTGKVDNHIVMGGMGCKVSKKNDIHAPDAKKRSCAFPGM